MGPGTPHGGGATPRQLGAEQIHFGESTRKRHDRRLRAANGAGARWKHRTLIATGLVLIAGVAAWQIYANAWSTRSSNTGTALVHAFVASDHLAAPLTAGKGKAEKSSLASCRMASSNSAVRGLLEIPKLEVVAPVEQNTNDAQLNVAVGHDPYSVWPGTTGNAVLAAHDVSYFENLSQAAAGDQVLYVTPCRTYYFRVQSHSIVPQGSTVFNTSRPALTLVTCWPTNALWFTPDRFLVTASFVGSRPTRGNRVTYLSVSPPPAVPIPGELASQGVTLTTYSLPMGSFALSGKPNQSWAQTTSPLLVEDSAVQAFIAGVRALTEDRLAWWRSIAPTVSPPTPLIGASNPGYNAGLNVTVTAFGTTANSVRLTDTITVSGGRAPGVYRVSVTDLIENHKLVIATWKMSRP